MKKRIGIVVMALAWIAVAAAFAQTSADQGHTTVQHEEQAADAARERGDIPASLTLYKRALVGAPGWQQGWWYYGSLLYDQNQYAEAVVAFRKLVGLDPGLGDGWAMLGLCEYETRDYNRALADLQRGQREGLSDAAALGNVVDFHRAVLLNLHGDSDGAMILLSSLYLKGVRSEDVQVALGLSLLRIPVAPASLDPSDDALVHEAGSLAALLAKKQTEEAEIAFRSLLERYPKVFFLHYAYGGLLASLGRDDEAIAQFRAETELNPQSALAYLEWAFVDMRNQKYEEAEGLVRTAIRINDASFLAHYILGNALLMTGDPKAAVGELVTAKNLAPELPDIRYALSRAYAQMGDADLARQEQTAYLTLQKKSIEDRLALKMRYPGARGVDGLSPKAP